MKCCKRTGEIKKVLTKAKKLSLIKHLLQLQKKKKPQDFFTIFKTLPLFSRLFPGLGKFQDFFKNLRLCMNPVTIKSGLKNVDDDE